MNNNSYTELAKQLDDSLRTHNAIEPITIKYPHLTLHDAYQIQKAGIMLRQDRGEKIVGYKMGLTSHAKQNQMHISTPIFGVLTNLMEITSGLSITLEKFIDAKVEPEIAFILGKDIKGEVTPEEALTACSGVCAALDIIDSRYIDFKFTLIDVVADNCSAGGYVLGPIKNPADLDLKNLAMSLIVDDVLIKKGNSNAILDNPINSLVMLSRLLAVEKSYIKAGSVVLSGASTDAIDLKPNIRVVNQVESLSSAILISL